MTDTIFALSSGQVPSGVGVIRVSGKHAGACIDGLAGEGISPRQAHLRILRDKDNHEIDQALVLWFPGPNSFTGDDIAEFHIHGGEAVITRLSECLLTYPQVRLAEAGEFSMRAYHNGKMDLTQLEGLADIIQSKTEFQRQQAVKLRNGWNSDIYDNLRSRVLRLMSHIEASIDFADEELDVDSLHMMHGEVDSIISEIDSHLKSSLNHETLRDGFRVVLTGPVNVGKSSLLNRLAQRPAALVSREAGTTRDIVEVRMDLQGYPVIIQDTAGFRDTDDRIETMGMELSKSALAKADLIIAIGDNIRSCHDIEALSEYSKKLIQVRNKIDLGTPQVRSNDEIPISVIRDEGMDELITSITTRVRDDFKGKESGVILRLRHQVHLEQCRQALNSIKSQPAGLVDMIGEDIRRAAAHIGAISGKIDVEDMLDRVFADFCIGK